MSMSKEKLDRIKNFLEHVETVVVDEMSMLSAEILALLGKRMRQLYNADQIFGGMIIIVSGDFCK